MSQFLSPAWLAELEAAAAGDQRLRDASRGVHLTVRHHVSGGPDGDVDYRITFADGEVTVRPGPGEADVAVYQTYATAAAVSQGVLAPADAFASGRARLGGRPGLMTQHREALSPLGDVFAELRERTTYDVQATQAGY